MQEGAGPRPYDVSVNYLIELDPHGWLDWIGLPADGPIQSIETDLATVLAEADKILRVGGSSPYVAHIEVQANRDPLLPSRLLQYHGLIHDREQIRVETTVVLLRPTADGLDLSERYDPYEGEGVRKVSLDYQVIRLWERSAESCLNGGIGVLPLAPLAAVEQTELPSIMLRLEDRVRREVDDSTASELRSALLLLLNLRYDEDEVRAMIRGLPELRDTPVYRVIVEEGLREGRERGLREGRAEGRAEGRLTQTRRLLLELGADKLGPPDDATAATLAQTNDITTLERLLRRLLTANTWTDLLAQEV